MYDRMKLGTEVSSHYEGHHTMLSSARTVKICYCYAHASRGDSKLCEALAAHMSALNNRYSLRTFSTAERISDAPREWEEEEVREGVDQADLIFLLLSADFLADHRCMERKSRALVRQSEGRALVVPVLLRKVFLEPTDLGGLQMLSKNGRPVIAWRDQALAEIVFEVDQLLKNLLRSWRTSDEWLLEGNACYEQGQYEKALEAYGQAARLGHRDALISARMGHLFYDCGHYTEALQHYEEVAALGGTDATAFDRMGHILSGLKRNGEALSAYMRATRLGSRDRVTFSQMRHLLYEQQRSDEALSAYMQAAPAGHTDAQAWYRTGLLLSERTRYLEAQQAYS